MSWTVTYTGKIFDCMNPKAGDICIEDIAHALSQMCRFCGHTKSFYSVAQHSVFVATEVEDHLMRSKKGHTLVTAYTMFAALLHDASEAYICDIITPLKPHLPQYKEIEEKIMKLIAKRFGVPYKNFTKPIIKEKDLVALATEKRDLVADSDKPWMLLMDVSPVDYRIVPQSPIAAEESFLNLFDSIVCLIKELSKESS